MEEHEHQEEQKKKKQELDAAEGGSDVVTSVLPDTTAITSNVDAAEEVQQVKKKKKKKRKLEPVEGGGESPSVSVDDSGISCPQGASTDEGEKKKKKKKKQQSETAESGSESVASPNTVPACEIEDAADGTETKKNKKKKRKSDVPEVQCEATTSTVLADNATSEQDAPAEKPPNAPYAGQWGSATLGSDARNEKFLRLMGGFKSSTKSKETGKIKFASTALSGKREKQLLQGLESQFEQARETHLVNRGLGLGFAAASAEQPSGPGFNFPT